MVHSLTSKIARIPLGVPLLILLSTACVAQNVGAGEDWGDALVKWDTQCSEKGCQMFADVLRGDSGNPADPKNPREYITIAVAIDRGSLKPAYFAFHMPPNAEPGQGVFVAFARTTKEGDKWKSSLDEDGAIRIPFDSCDKDSCVGRVRSGLLGGGKGGRTVDMLDKFLSSDHVLLLYMRESKPYRTMVILSSFKKEYKRVLTSDLAAPKGRN